jgi:hypothetical protein
MREQKADEPLDESFGINQKNIADSRENQTGNNHFLIKCRRRRNVQNCQQNYRQHRQGLENILKQIIFTHFRVNRDDCRN